MRAVALDNGNTVLVRRSTLEWILFGVLGVLVLAVSGWAGRTIMDHDRRLNAQEVQTSRATALDENVQSNLVLIRERLSNIERLLQEHMAPSGGETNANGGGG